MSNWQQLKTRLDERERPRKRARAELSDAVKRQKVEQTKVKKPDKVAVAAAAAAAAPLPPTSFVALDCEMVGVGSSGKRSALARCAIVGHDGALLYDKHVRPKERITDFRTKYSGVRAKDLKDAISLGECEVAALLKDKVLCGHALSNDLKVLLLTHPKNMIRDTATYGPLMRTSRNGRLKPKALRVLAKEVLGETIQEGEHSPAIDARVALHIYRVHAAAWERSLKATQAARKRHGRPVQQAASDGQR